MIGYELRATPELDVTAQQAFWNMLSTDNNYEMPERVYGLRALVSGVLPAAADPSRLLGRVWLAVQREAG